MRRKCTYCPWSGSEGYERCGCARHFRRKGGRGFVKELKDIPDYLRRAAEKVARDFNLSAGWLNTGPAELVRMGLPEGFEKRVIKKSYGRSLTVYYISRFDQIHFKLYAAVDRGGYHVNDLLALNPSEEEIEKAAKWAITHEPSQGFRMMLIDFLEKIGFKNVADRI